MAFSNFLYLTDQTAGAPRNSGTNGDLNTLLNWALVTTHGGWSREYHNAGTNESVFRAATGNRNRLYVRHDSSASSSAALAVVRGCEDASSASTLIDPFPTVSQLANNVSNWRISSLTNTTSRAFKILVWETGILYFSQVDGTDYDWGGFLDAHAIYSNDLYSTCVIVRAGTTSTTTNNISVTTSPGKSGSNSVFFVRDFTGTIKSTLGTLNASGGLIGNVNGAPAPLGGYLAKIQRERVSLNCSGNSYEGASTNSYGSSSIVGRAFIPNFWSPFHGSATGINNIDTFTDTAYDNTASFGFVKFQANASSFAILETTNTWKTPAVDI